MREFRTGTRRQSEEVVLVQFVLDDVPLSAKKPKPAVFAYLTAASARGVSPADQIKATLDFLEAVIVGDDESETVDGELVRDGKSSRQHFRDRLLDPEDELDLDDALEVLAGLAEEWSGRPTTSPSGSTSGRRSTGSRSTGAQRSRASTR